MKTSKTKKKLVRNRPSRVPSLDVNAPPSIQEIMAHSLEAGRPDDPRKEFDRRRAASAKPNWYSRSIGALNRLIRKHPRSILLFDFLKGRLIARGTDHRKIHEKWAALSKPGSSFLVYEPSKTKAPLILAFNIA